MLKLALGCEGLISSNYVRPHESELNTVAILSNIRACTTYRQQAVCTMMSQLIKTVHTTHDLFSCLYTI